MNSAVQFVLISAALLPSAGSAFAEPSKSDRDAFRMGYGIQSALTAGRQFTDNGWSINFILFRNPPGRICGRAAFLLHEGS